MSDIKKERLTEYIKCSVCNKMFLPHRPNHKYCSAECREKVYIKKYKYKKKTEFKRKCKQCGKEFVTNDNKKKYCSDECRLEFNESSYKHVSPTKRTCPICNKIFLSAHVNKSYCSKNCYDTAKKRRQHGN